MKTIVLLGHLNAIPDVFLFDFLSSLDEIAKSAVDGASHLLAILDGSDFPVRQDIEEVHLILVKFIFEFEHVVHHQTDLLSKKNIFFFFCLHLLQFLLPHRFPVARECVVIGLLFDTV